MEWIVRIEGEDEKRERIRIVFSPHIELIQFFGEAKVKNNQWSVFSQDTHELKIDLEQLKQVMEGVVIVMRRRLVEYDNLDKGFSVLKWIALEEDETIDE